MFTLRWRFLLVSWIRLNEELDDGDTTTFSKDGFDTPEKLTAWLREQGATEEEIQEIVSKYDLLTFSLLK